MGLHLACTKASERNYYTNPYGAACYGLSAAGMVSWIHDFANTYTSLTGRDTLICTATRGAGPGRPGADLHPAAAADEDAGIAVGKPADLLGGTEDAGARPRACLEL